MCVIGVNESLSLDIGKGAKPTKLRTGRLKSNTVADVIA
jgi:hypothetical protein